VEATKPAEASRASSIFGSAKPVDTASREREIEEKIKKLDLDVHFTSEEKENMPRER
jgi:translation initiation factor 4B